MPQDQTVADAVEIIDTALGDLAACGCDPLDTASALISAGLAELRDADAPPIERMALYRVFMEHVLAALSELRGMVPVETRH